MRYNIDNNLKEFDLIFYDELYAPDDCIRLTIRRNGAQDKSKKKEMVLGGGLAIDLKEYRLIPDIY